MCYIPDILIRDKLITKYPVKKYTEPLFCVIVKSPQPNPHKGESVYEYYNTRYEVQASLN